MATGEARFDCSVKVENFPCKFYILHMHVCLGNIKMLSYSINSSAGCFFSTHLFVKFIHVSSSSFVFHHRIHTLLHKCIFPIHLLMDIFMFIPLHVSLHILLALLFLFILLLSCVPTRWKDTHNLKLTKFCPTVSQSSYTIYIPI